jgi:hypothetical protein
MALLEEPRAVCHGHALVVGAPADPNRVAIAGALRCMGMLHVDHLTLPGIGRWPSRGRWALGVVTPRAAALLQPVELEWLVGRCGCVHVDEVMQFPGEAGRRLGVEPADRDAPPRAKVCAGPLAEVLQHSLAGYVDATTVVLDPIQYDDRPCQGGGDPERSGGIKAIEGTVAWLRHVDEGGEACVVSRENLLVSRLPLMRAIVDGFRIPDCESPVRAFGGGRTREALELGLLHIWAFIAAAEGAPLMTREPWPDGVRHVLSLRLDYDRPVPEAQWTAFRSWQRHIGLRASWYFLGTTIDRPRIASLIAEGDEVGLHYRRIEVHGVHDLERLRSAVQQGGGHVVGATCHGGNYQAGSDLRWLCESGLRYSEQLGRCSWHPYHGLMPDGSWSPMLLTARHVSVDVSLTPPRADLTYMLRTQSARLRLQGHTVVMNHPDINFDATREAVDRCTSPGTASWTQAEVTQWWKDAHAVATSCCDRADSGEASFVQAHGSRLQPVVRIWADVLCHVGKPEVGPWGTHTLVASDRFKFQTARSRGALA